MKTKETSTREQAMAWWKQLCLSCELDDTHYVLDNLIRRHIGFERKYHSLTGREIEQIWVKETQSNITEIVEDLKIQLDKAIQNSNPLFPNYKSNQKQFKQFDESLFKAYIDKFSNEDKLKMLAKLSCEISTVNPILNDLLNRISCYGGNK